ncbi:MAG: hypothetical protein DMF94_00740 [Acidobacteria bacterium]|nr:MAG: hypothetical protein DMF94_00740 [Acidobacteriota bacterium]
MSDQFPPVRSSDDAVLRAAGRSSDSMPAQEVTIPEAHLGDYLRVVYKRRWLAVTTLLLVVVTAIVYTFTATPVYEARTQLLIEVDNPNVVSFKEVIEQDKATSDYYQTQYRILQSRTLARRTLSKLNLWGQFQPVPEAAQGFSIRTLVAGSVGYVTQLFTSAPKIEPRADSETTIQSKAIDQFLANLTIAPVRNSRLVDVKYASPYPELAAAVANTTTAMYIEQSLDFKYTSSREASDWLGQRLGEQRKQVESTEAALQRYREQNDALSLEERQNIVVQKLADLNGAGTERPDGPRHGAGDSGESVRPAAEERARRAAAAAGAALGQARRQASGHGEESPRHPDRRGEDPGRDRESRRVDETRLSDRAHAGAEPDARARSAEGGRAGAEPQGDRLWRAAA